MTKKENKTILRSEKYLLFEYAKRDMFLLFCEFAVG